MSRRIPLPRLTQQQRMARWQRERRQQTVIVVVFTVLLFSAIGLMVWAGATRYYDGNLKAIVSIDGHDLPSRLYNHERGYELVKFYADNGIPVAFENDPQIQQQKSDYDGVAINSLAEQLLLEAVARQDHYAISDADVRARYVDAFSQFRSRHVLVKIDDAATDKEAAAAAALAKATDIAKQLKAAPNDQELWNKLATTSDDPGSKDKGGEIGWASKGNLVDAFSQFRTRHVLVKIDDAATDKDAAAAAALVKATDIAKQLKAAPNDQELWNKLAATSDDPGSKDKGGEIGWASKGNLVDEYEAAVKALAPGQITDPVKTSFGYHVVQLEERRGPEANPLVKRWLTSGYGLDEILQHTKYDMLREHYTQVAQAQSVRSPTEQVHLLHILINLPSPVSKLPTDFTNALKKVSEVKAELAKGTDFAALAKQYSDAKTEGEAGGDIGWFARGQLDSASKERELFALAPGAVSRQFSSVGSTEFYKLVEKDPARALSEEQTTKIHDSAYAYWFDQNRRLHGLQKLVTGYEFAP